MKGLRISALAASSLLYQTAEAINLAETEAVSPVEETLAMPTPPTVLLSAYCNITTNTISQRWSVIDFSDNKTDYTWTILGLIPGTTYVRRYVDNCTSKTFTSGESFETEGNVAGVISDEGFNPTV